MKETTTKTSNEVTFIALLSPKQFFTFDGLNYSFQDGKFTTSDAALIAFLSENHACKKQ